MMIPVQHDQLNHSHSDMISSLRQYANLAVALSMTTRMLKLKR
jgi:hypothetical protein